MRSRHETATEGVGVDRAAGWTVRVGNRFRRHRALKSFIGLFTVDAVWEYYGRGAEKLFFRFNRDELRAAVAKRLEGLKNKGIQSRHYQTNTMLTPVAPDKVEATTMLGITWQGHDEKQPVLVTTGIFRDVVVRTPAGWRFASTTELVHQSDLPQ